MAAKQEAVTELLERIGGQVDTGTLFGEARMLEGTAVIPVARISYGGGGGGGQGPAPTGEGGEATGEGTGVGFGVRAQPLGVVEVRQNELRWVPVIDWSRLLLVWSVVSGAMLLLSALVGARRR